MWRRIDSYAVSAIKNGRLGVVNAGTAWCKRSPVQTQIRTQPGVTLSCRASKGEYLDGSRVSKTEVFETALSTWRGTRESFRDRRYQGCSRLLNGSPRAVIARNDSHSDFQPTFTRAVVVGKAWSILLQSAPMRNPSAYPGSSSPSTVLGHCGTHSKHCGDISALPPGCTQKT